jgi:hypothetical protein
VLRSVPQEALCTCYNIRERTVTIVQDGPVLAEMVRTCLPDLVAKISGKSDISDMHVRSVE